MYSSFELKNVISSCCFFRVALVFNAFVVAAIVAKNAHAGHYWTQWVSEEHGGPPVSCSASNEASAGFACSGNYCDNIAILCNTLPFNLTLNPASVYWTPSFSEEDSGIASQSSEGWYRNDGDTYEVCHRSAHPGLVIGTRCKGSNCDNISLKCAQPILWRYGKQYPVRRVKNCGWTGWFSEERQGIVEFGSNRYITGVRCQGRYCDNKQFYVCSLTDPAPRVKW